MRPLTNESVFDLDELPARLVIIGAGPVGIELGQAFRRLGSEVTLLEAGTALAGLDTEVAEPLLHQLAQEGISLRENVNILRIEPRGTGVRLFLEGTRVETSIDGSHLLIAAGRRPNVEGMGLEVAGVRFSKAGIATDARLRSSNRRIFAIGDVAGQGAQTHLASYHAGLVLRGALFRQPARVRPGIVPSVIYADPEIATIGLTEAAARAKHRHLRVLRWPFSENDRAQAEQETAGLIKVITDARGRVLGAAIAGKGAGEQIGLWSLAISRGLRVQDIAATVQPYPTRGEISRRVAVSFYAQSLRSPWLPRLLGFFRWFG